MKDSTVAELLAAAEHMLEQFEEWEGPEEDERDDASRARNESVRAWTRLKAAADAVIDEADDGFMVEYHRVPSRASAP